MGTYTTITSLDTLMPNYELNTTTSSTPTSQVIDWAESMINSKIGKKYDVSSSPFDAYATTPPLVRTLAEQLSMGYIFKTWSRGGKESLTRGDAMIEMAMEVLDKIADCKIDLVNTGGSVVTKTSTQDDILSNTDGYFSTFDEDDPLHWKVDQDKLDDISDGRS